MAAIAGHGRKIWAIKAPPTAISTHGTASAIGRPTPMSAACFGHDGPSSRLNVPDDDEDETEDDPTNDGGGLQRPYSPIVIGQCMPAGR